MGNIVGLDLGTNSIGWSVINKEAILNKEKTGFIKAAGSRIIPMDAKTISDYESGNLKSAASARTKLRAIRRLYQRAVLRRERLLRVLNILGFLPPDFKENIDFEKNLGRYKDGTEPLIAYYKDEESGRNRFRFQDAFKEMIDDLKKSHPELVDKQKKIPYDWTLYYLRHKALTNPISKYELAWVLLSYNAKRGYYQLRGLKNNENDDSKQKTFERLTVKNVAVDDNRVKSQNGKQKYIVTYKNGCTQTFTSVEPPYKTDDTVDCIVTTTLNADGSIKTGKDGNPKISVSTPGEDDWTLIKAKTESDIEDSKEYVSTYIYKNLLLSPTIKIKGSLVGTIDRKFYKEELQAILETQIDLRQELKDKELYSQCVEELYKNNIDHRKTLLKLKHDIVDFIVNDIIFYQRPLKTKKYLIANCPYEAYHYFDKEKNLLTKPVKCIPKSHPLFQEFRIWQFLSNVKIFKRIEQVDGKIKTDVDVTSTYINGTTYVNLYEKLSGIAEISQTSFLKMLGLKGSNDYRWNYEDDNDKKYLCNPTKATIIKALDKIGIKNIDDSDLLKLWHILYSVEDPIEIKTALRNFAEKHGWDKNKNTFADNLAKTTLSEDGYGAYSEKAIKKLLALMRCGEYWNADNIDSGTKEKIKKIIGGNISELGLPEKAITRLIELKEIKDFQGLPLWLACYVVYGRHSESSDSTHWKSPKDIDAYINNEFKPHCLRNPVVEMIVLEALKIIRDIWETYGEISEIHVEIGRDLKNNSKERKRIASKIRENERTNRQAKVRIIELLGNNHRVSHNDIVRYKIWKEQGGLSPYTGQTISEEGLFSDAYQIDHIIPQAKYFDDSISNKVLCESEVNRTKGARLGYEFIIKNKGNEINIGGGKNRTI